MTEQEEEGAGRNPWTDSNHLCRVLRRNVPGVQDRTVKERTEERDDGSVRCSLRVDGSRARKSSRRMCWRMEDGRSGRMESHFNRTTVRYIERDMFFN